ncbi:BatD family protein [Sulfurovum sp.]|uniref:BatD family protein n=1 Tax=Sulfurovum sp. TaxID=1969726 RepID=UPI0026201005|nr:BatD family protein [Sulfurovum sp.]
MMKKYIHLLLLFGLFLTLANAGSVTAEVSQKEVVAGNMVQLRIKAEGKRAVFPHIEKIDDARVLGRSQRQNNSISYINGKMSMTHTTNLILSFAPQHTVTIPSYSVKVDGQTYTTKPITVKVVKASAPGMGSSVKYSLHIRADKKTVIVGEPLVVTVYFSLKTGVRLADNPQYTKPVFKGFFVKDVNEPRSYIKGNQQVQELRYILTPQKEGNFTIGPATARISEIDRSRQDMFGRFFGSNGKSIVSNTLNITVKPKPKDTDLVGNFTLTSQLDHQQVKANKPVNLTVRIEGNGSLEDFDLGDYEIDGVTVYSDDAKIDSKLSGDRLKSTFVKSFAFISDHDFTIPKRTISVYDPEKKTVTTLTIPAYHIKVKAAAHTAAVPTAGSNEGKVQTNLPQPGQNAEKTVVKKVEVVRVNWWMIVLAFLAGALSVYLLSLLPKFKSRVPSPFKESEALKLLYAHINDDKEAEAMVRKLYAKQNGDKSVIIDKKELKALVDKYRVR